MTESQMKELAAIMEKSLALSAEIEEIAATAPPKKRKAFSKARAAADSAVVNIAQALRIAKDQQKG